MHFSLLVFGNFPYFLGFVQGPSTSHSTHVSGPVPNEKRQEKKLYSTLITLEALLHLIQNTTEPVAETRKSRPETPKPCLQLFWAQETSAEKRKIWSSSRVVPYQIFPRLECEILGYRSAASKGFESGTLSSAENQPAFLINTFKRQVAFAKWSAQEVPRW